MRQPQLAEKVGVTVRQISRLETGVQSPTWPVVIALCHAFGVEPNAFAVEPAERDPQGRGRPKKEEAGGELPEVAKGKPARGQVKAAKPRKPTKQRGR
jgi:transcriptional regulator with XRE-family HTH domain